MSDLILGIRILEFNDDCGDSYRPVWIHVGPNWKSLYIEKKASLPTSITYCTQVLIGSQWITWSSASSLQDASQSS
jgi:hypothetical protein